MMETALVFDRNGKTICFHEPAGRTSGSIPDTQSLWDIVWENRENLGGVAHTHPWNGPAHPSMTDLDTFSANERGLGQHLLWPVVTFTDVVYVVRNVLGGSADVAGQWCLARPRTRENEDTEDTRVLIEGIEELRARSRK